ncbi:hypothetical protein JCM19237_2169 [Photobacterium aphoticum]|uniref:Uncharacterized protein n=1 Tax=Photobacterium aphoticum TaxID=754436 RepID=A0A090QP70_9GAMM|nr:hypothetical protein JCM19237_2169 [Photobacterium aphoticum]
MFAAFFVLRSLVLLHLASISLAYFAPLAVCSYNPLWRDCPYSLINGIEQACDAMADK